MKLRWMRVVGAALVLSACAGDAPPPGAGNTGNGEPGGATTAPAQSPAMLLDSAIPPAVAGEDGWNYQQSAEADLDGDGQAERVVLTARVEVYRGRPAWDDGQPWQVYVEAPDGERTYLYAQRLQLGSLTMRVGLPDAGRAPTVILLEHLPDRLSLYEVSYLGPSRAAALVRFQRALDPRGDIASPRLP